MTVFNPKALYSHFLQLHEGKLHFAAHSHHFWPDVTREAHLQCWDDAALLSDGKWNKVFSEVLPKAQKHIAHILNLKDRQRIAFAPNTHELSARILSLFVGRPALKILTTASEFHSWRRQILRLSELSGVSLTMVDTTDLRLNRQRFLDTLAGHLEQRPDVFFISQVFFDSGITLSVEDFQFLLRHCHQETLFVIDGYHGFAAVPTDLSLLEGRVFYLGGGYKYAQAGEGACFLVVPKGDWRPAHTGWFAEFGDLSRPSGSEVGYATNGIAFMGATFDPSGLYRFNAVWDQLQGLHHGVNEVHAIIRSLQHTFLKHLPEDFLKAYELTPLWHPSLENQGHFLTLAAKDSSSAQALEERLRKKKIIIDTRGERVRFGFGLYQDQGDVLELCERLKKLALNPE